MANQEPLRFTIFYAWQSDTPARHNRRLIQRAIEDAIDRINDESGFPFEVVLTHDTEDATIGFGLPNADLVGGVKAEVIEGVEPHSLRPSQASPSTV